MEVRLLDEQAVSSVPLEDKVHFEASGIVRPPITHTYRRRKIGEGMSEINGKQVEGKIWVGPTREEYVRNAFGD